MDDISGPGSKSTPVDNKVKKNYNQQRNNNERPQFRPNPNATGNKNYDSNNQGRHNNNKGVISRPEFIPNKNKENKEYNNNDGAKSKYVFHLIIVVNLKNLNLKAQ